MVEAKRNSGWSGCFIVLGMVGLAFAVLRPVFLQARDAARSEVAYDDGKALSRALSIYLREHRGRLPGSDWKRMLKVEPKLADRLQYAADEGLAGFAAVPGIYGRKLDELKPDAILFVQFHAPVPVDTLARIGDLGDPWRTDRSVVVTVEDVRNGHAHWQNRVPDIAYTLGRQGVVLRPGRSGAAR